MRRGFPGRHEDSVTSFDSVRCLLQILKYYIVPAHRNVCYPPGLGNEQIVVKTKSIGFSLDFIFSSLL